MLDGQKLSRRMAMKFADAWEVGHERWIMAPGGLLELNHIPDGWGLLEVKGPRVYRTQEPRTSDRVGMSKAESQILVHVARHLAGGWKGVGAEECDAN